MASDEQWLGNGTNGTTRAVRRTYALLDRVNARGHQRLARALSVVAKTLTGVEIEPGAVVGRGLVVRHGQGTVVGRGTVIGDACVLLHQVTLGIKDGGYPVVGDNVTIHAGAKILGPVSIGSHAVIGANAVVLQDVPEGCLAVGVPARVISPVGQPAD